MARLWRDTEGARKNKYLVVRRDGSVPEWPWFVLSAKDPAASTALRAYAAAADDAGMDPQYVVDIRDMAAEWEIYRAEHGAGDPDAPPHRAEDPEVLRALSETG